MRTDQVAIIRRDGTQYCTRSFGPGARKSLGEYKPLLISYADGKKVATRVIGTRTDPWNFDGSRAHGKFGKFRGVTFATRQEAIDYATPFAQKAYEDEVAEEYRKGEYGYFDICAPHCRVQHTHKT